MDGEHILESSVKTLPTSWFYHHKCYRSFTNKQLIELAEGRVAKSRRREKSDDVSRT